MDMFEIVKNEIISYMPKEYYCHLQFVHKVSLQLQKQKGGDRQVIEISSIAHDYGRVEGADNKMHPEKGAEKIEKFLRAKNYDDQKTKHVARCTLMHNKREGFETIEEEIVANADQLSKLLYHEAFMLLVKKDTYRERAEWGLKYLDKGYNNTTFKELKDEYYDLYMSKRSIFESVLEK